MLLKIDFESEIPIYSQLINAIVEGITKGQLKDGDGLPSVRQLAEDIGINMHTVNKSYNVLKQEGFVRLDRRKGAVISNSSSETFEQIVMKLEEELRPTLVEAFCKKTTRDEIAVLVDKLYKEYEGDE